MIAVQSAAWLKFHPLTMNCFPYTGTALALLSLICCTCSGAALTNALNESKNSWLAQGRFHTEAEAKAKLSEFAKTYSDRAGWERRAQIIRAGILRGASLEPLPACTALNPIHRGERRHDGYTVENVAFESRPGFFVTGNLYRPFPRKAGEKHPAVLVTHGHSADTVSGGRFRAGTQALGATLARAGAIVFAYDMVGYGEATQFKHKSDITLGLQLWNSIRAVDFIQSLPEVDAARVGITGESGGATQALLLAAVEDRITVTVPVVMVSAHFYGGCDCESGMPVHRSPDHESNNAEIAALAAPRPQLIISDGKDWTKNVPEVELPYIQNVYRLMNAESKVENLHLANEGHDYGPSKRAGAYAFLGKHLGLQLDRIRASDGTFNEQPVTLQQREALLVFDASHPWPEHALGTPDAVEAQFHQR